MTDKPASKSRNPSDIFPFLSEDFRQRVVKNALKHRSESDKLRRQRASALNRLRVDGYRHPCRAPWTMLLRPVLNAIQCQDHELTRAILNSWIDSRGALRDRTAEHLASRGLPVAQPPDAQFDGYWTREELREECEAFAATDDDVDCDSVGLMLCLLARRFCGLPPLSSPMFNEWLDALRDLQPDASEWAEADTFVEWVEDIRRDKERELIGRCRRQILSECRSLQERFDGELRYVGVDPSPWPGLVEDRPVLIKPALQLLKVLTRTFEEYGPIRPQAPTRDEELERAVQRQACEDIILKDVGIWQQRVARHDAPDEDTTGKEVPMPRAVDRALAGPQSLSVASSNGDDSTASKIKTLQEDRERLEVENRRLREVNSCGDQEAKRLQEEVTRSMRMEEHWRRAYVEERRRVSPDDCEPVAAEPVESVREAIALARKLFPDRLLFKLNSRSKEDTPFANPSEVFDALAWLATAYRNGPTHRIKETCPGWFHKSKQSTTSMGRYPEWYETRVNGTMWKLGAHLGKGVRRDPHCTIRIGFAWDEQNERVIVGYIGQHQRNQSS